MTYIIAEIGQNHNGRVEAAHALIEACAVPIRDNFHDQGLRGVNAVKLTVRDTEWEMSADAAAAPYDSPHSYGATYGEHRAALELTEREIVDCYEHALQVGLEFVVTICAPRPVESLLRWITPMYLKVASRDLTNGPLLTALADTRIPMILSTGMADSRDLTQAIDLVNKRGGKIGAILHCLSQYPADYDRLNLRTIQWLRSAYGYPIGYSDHSIGIAMAPVAVALGAQLIEKHVTLSRAGKGSDHAGSLEPDGLRRMVRDIRNTERALGHKAMFRDPGVESARLKLERSIASRVPIAAGDIIDESNTCMLSPGSGYGWHERGKLWGRVAQCDIEPKTLILPSMLV